MAKTLKGMGLVGVGLASGLLVGELATGPVDPPERETNSAVVQDAMRPARVDTAYHRVDDTTWIVDSVVDVPAKPVWPRWRPSGRLDVGDTLVLTRQEIIDGVVGDVDEIRFAPSAAMAKYGTVKYRAKVDFGRIAPLAKAPAELGGLGEVER